MKRSNLMVCVLSLAAALATSSLLTGCTHPSNDESTASTRAHLSASSEVPAAVQSRQSQEAQGRAADAARNAAAMKAASGK